MVGHSSLFSQLLLLLNRRQFARRVKECCAEKAAKGFSCWSQFVAMMFCQLAQAKSLREIIDGLASSVFLAAAKAPAHTLSKVWSERYGFRE